jgi:hypothetical protein
MRTRLNPTCFVRNMSIENLLLSILLQVRHANTAIYGNRQTRKSKYVNRGIGEIGER